MSNVIHFADLIEGMRFPCTKEELVQYVQERGASEDALDLLRAMPMEYFDSAADIYNSALLVEHLPGTDLDITDDMGIATPGH